MLKLLVEYGFCIIDVKKSEYGDGHKLISIYDICTPRKMRLSITDRCNMDCFFCHSEGNFTCNSGHMPLSAIEQLLIQANRMNFTEITITGGEPLTYLEGVLSVNLNPPLTINTFQNVKRLQKNFNIRNFYCQYL